MVIKIPTYLIILLYVEYYTSNARLNVQNILKNTLLLPQNDNYCSLDKNVFYKDTTKYTIALTWSRRILYDYYH